MMVVGVVVVVGGGVEFDNIPKILCICLTVDMLDWNVTARAVMFPV